MARLGSGKLDWSRIEPWDYIVVNVSAEYHKKYGMVELDDIKQELYQWFVEHPNKLSEWESIGKKDAKNLIYRSLRNQALDYCQKWKAKSIGYEVSDLFYYEPDMVEALLPSVLREEFTVMPVLNLGKTGRPPAPSEGGNMMAMMVEIHNAYCKLNTEDRVVLFYKYAESLDFAAIAKEMQLDSQDAARMRHNRAIKKLITRIGGFKPHLERDIAKPVAEEPHEIVDTHDDNSDEDGHEQAD
jgi:DNA-directed RNA polymerase specialized sigma24 family protein